MRDIYYAPEDYGLEQFDKLEENLSYEFHLLVVWRAGVRFYWAEDSG